MITPRIEFVPQPQPTTAHGSPRLFYTFRARSSASDDLAVVIEKRQRELRHVRDGSAEAAEILREIGMLQARSGRVRESLDTYQRSLKTSRKASDHRQAARALEAMGMLHARRGEYEASLECFFEALRESPDAADPRGEAASWMEISSVYSETGMHLLAFEALEHSIKLLEAPSDAYLQARARVSAANVLVAMDRTTEAIDHALRALVALEAYDDYVGQVDALLVVGSVYRKLGELTTSAGYTERAAVLSKERAHVSGQAAALFGLAQVLRDAGSIESAIERVEEGLTVATDAALPEFEWRLHELAAELFELRDDPQNSLVHYRRFVELRELSRSNVRDERFDELRARHEASGLERERDALRNEIDDLRVSLAEKNRELTFATLSLVQKSELLNEVRSQLGDLVQTSAGYSSSIVQPILEDIADGSGAEESWRMFEMQFDHVHNDFMQRLAERFPSLTPMELKICTLTRIDLSAKEVGRLLHVSERNIQNHRYRLRKKLQLAPEANLASFLAGI